MTKHEFTFDVWFDNLELQVLDLTNIPFRDEDSVRADYDAGRSFYDVAADIAAEYAD
jgi:hypothetical protein